jgi:hypothetical protein
VRTGILRSKEALARHIADLEEKVGRNVDPLLFLIELAAGHDAYAEEMTERMIKQGILERGDARVLQMKFVSREDRMAAATVAVKFIHPQLASTQTTVDTAKPAKVLTEVRGLIQDEAAVEALENVTIALSKRRSEEAAANLQKEIQDGSTFD